MASDDVIITIRMLMVGKEIGGIIGKGGTNVSNFREQSGAKITISSEQNCPERIVTISGGQNQIFKAVELITDKMFKDVNSGLTNDATSQVPVTIRLVVPASQCGSIIGKGGAKIKEIRDTTGCAIQVQSDMLPNSSERSVTLSGVPSTIVHCINMLCDVMIQFPAKTATVPYHPIPMLQSAPFVMGGQYSMSEPPLFRRPSNKRYGANTFESAVDYEEATVSGSNTVSVSNFPAKMVNTTTQELTVDNEVMGTIIGKGGSRINEIRKLSGANIRIARKEDDNKAADTGSSSGSGDVNMDVNDDNNTAAASSSTSSPGGFVERKITIVGTPESICFAQYLINLSVQMYAPQDDSMLDAPVAHSPARARSSGILGHPPSLLSGGIFTQSGLGAQNFQAALLSARNSFAASSGKSGGHHHRGGGFYNRPTHKRTSQSPPETQDFSTEMDLAVDNSTKDRKKVKREKFQPY